MIGRVERSPSPEYNPLAIGDDTDFVALPVYKPVGTQEIDFDGLLGSHNGPVLKLFEDLSKGCGGQLWPAGMVLSKYMLREHRNDLEDGVVLELGAGGGLVGLVVALGCKIKSPLYITDQEEMFALMGKNIALNGLESRVVPLIWNWGEHLPAELQSNPPKHILAADCVYFEPAFPLLLQTLGDILTACAEATIYFCFKKRRNADKQFMKQAKKLFACEEIEDIDKPVWSREQLFMYTFRSKTSGSKSESSASSMVGSTVASSRTSVSGDAEEKN